MEKKHNPEKECPFAGEARCISCGYRWTIFLSTGIKFDPDLISFHCPHCKDKGAGRLVSNQNFKYPLKRIKFLFHE